MSWVTWTLTRVVSVRSLATDDGGERTRGSVSSFPWLAGELEREELERNRMPAPPDAGSLLVLRLGVAGDVFRNRFGQLRDRNMTVSMKVRWFGIRFDLDVGSG